MPPAAAAAALSGVAATPGAGGVVDKGGPGECLGDLAGTAAAAALPCDLGVVLLLAAGAMEDDDPTSPSCMELPLSSLVISALACKEKAPIAQ